MSQYGEQMVLPRTNVSPRQAAVVAGLDTACATVRRQAQRPATHLIPHRPEPAMQRPGVVLRRGWREVIKCEAPLPISCIRCWERGVRHGQGQGCQHCHVAIARRGERREGHGGPCGPHSCVHPVHPPLRKRRHMKQNRTLLQHEAASSGGWSYTSSASRLSPVPRSVLAPATDGDAVTAVYPSNASKGVRSLDLA